MRKKLLSLSVIMIMIVSLMPVIPASAQGTHAGGGGGTSGEWEYTYFSMDGTEGVAVTGYTGSDIDVFIPASLDETEEDGAVISYPVLKVDECAFQNNTSINSVTLSDSIKIIGESAFEGASNMVCIVTTETLAEIGAGAFKGCAAFNSVVLGDNVTQIGAGAFDGCSELKIYCNDSSYATQYAVDNNISYVLMTTDAEPETYEQDGITYYIQNGEAILMSGENTSGDVVIPSMVTTNTGKYAITKINSGAFKDCSQITSAELPNTVVKIGEMAFSGCSSLAKVNIPEGITVINKQLFENCETLRTITIPASVTDIESYAFHACHLLTKINLSEGLERISNAVFEDCTKLTEIVIPDSVTEIGWSVFLGCSSLSNVTISNNMTTITDQTFSYTQIKDIVLPNGLKTISNNAFEHCTLLASVKIPDGVTSVGYQAFWDCKNLTSVIFPDSVTSIGEEVFSESPNAIMCVKENSYAYNYAVENDIPFYIMKNDDDMPEIYEENGLTYYISDGTATLLSCESIKANIVVPDTVKNCPVTLINDSAFKDNAYITSVTLPNTIVEIKPYAFYHCYSLEEINIPEGVTKIGEFAFCLCEALKNIEFPDSIVYIGRNAFYRCLALTEVILPPNITEIKPQTFNECKNLKNITIPENIKTIDGLAFLDTALEIIYIPESVTEISESDAFDYDTVICVKENSYAHTYAIENDVLYFIVSDDIDSPIIKTINGIKYFLYNHDAIILSSENLSGNVVIPSEIDGFAVTKIRQFAFSEQNMTSVTLHDGLIEIGSNAFQSCEQLEAINIPDSVIKIGDGTFLRCTKLKEISFPDNVILGSGVLQWCTSLSSAKLPANAENISDWTFGECTSLKKVEIPKNVKEIGGYAFADCNSIETIEFPEVLTFISTGAFSRCSSIKTVTIPDKVIYVGSESFQDCTSLENVTLLNNQNWLQIGDGAFNGCSSLKTINLNDYAWADPGAFPACPNLILHVKENSSWYNYAIENNLPYFLIPETDNPYFSSGQEIMGTVTSLSGAPKANVTVELIDKYKNIRETVTTDETGSYAFTYAEVGAYTIRAEDAEGNTGNENIYIKRKNAFDVYLTGNTDLTIKDSVTISGSVTNENGAAISGASISLIDENGLTIGFAQTEAGGRYAVENVPNGTYTLRAEASGGGSAVSEITVFAKNGDIEHNITIAQSALISGKVVDENGDAVVWAEITVVNSEGNIVASLNSDKNGCYSTGSLPTDTYSIAAVLENISSIIEGSAVVDAKQPGNIEAEEIVMTEKEKGTATISGKIIDVNRQPRTATVVLKDVFLNEVAVCNTAENGKYNFYDVADGIYSVIADTEDEAGFTVVTVIHGRVFLSITTVIVYKTVTAEAVETLIDALPSPDAQLSQIGAERKRIVRAKIAYDALTPMDKRRVNPTKLDKLNALIAKLTEDKVTVNDSEGNVTVSGLETIWSAEEIENSTDAAVVLSITPEDSIAAFADGDEMNDEQLNNKKITDKAAEDSKTIIKSYDISLTKSAGGTQKQIHNIEKDSEGMGSLEITIDIPQASRGHKNYSVIHSHNGQIFTLVDIDDNPDTITFETGKLSEFVLTYDDNDSSGQGPDDDIAYDSASKTATIHSTVSTTADVIFAAYSDGVLTDLKVKPQQSIEIGDIPVTAEDFDTSNADEVRIMVWDTLESMKPVFDMLSVPLNAN